MLPLRPRPRNLAVALALGALAVSARAAAGGGDGCITPETRKEVWACPGGTLPASSQGPKLPVGSADAVKLPPKPPRPEEPAPPPGGRSQSFGQRQRALLVQEIARVEALLVDTPATARDRPQLVLRLAESYAELEASAVRGQTEAQIAAQRLRASDASAAEAQDAVAAKERGIVKEARRSAIRHYTALKNDHAGFCRNPGPPTASGCIDEVLYDLAYEHEQAGHDGEASAAYLELIDQHPSSRFVAHAYLAFGERFFAEAQGDPSRWGLAAQAYESALRATTPDEKLEGYLRYKLAYVHWNTNDPAAAVAGFRAVIELAGRKPQIPGIAGLSAAARRDIVPVYAQGGDPQKAFDTFRPLSGDTGGSLDKTFGMLEALGVALLDTGHYAAAVTVLRDLQKRAAGSDRVCSWQTLISKATMAERGGDKKGVRAALDEQLRLYTRFVGDNHPDEPTFACANDTAALVVETAAAWHLEAVGSGGVKGTGDVATKDHAAALYETALATWTTADFRRFSFPTLVKQDWPTIARIRYWQADLLYDRQDWKRCGPAFDAAFDAAFAEDPSGPDANAAAFGAAVCHARHVAETPAPAVDPALAADHARLEKRALTSEERSEVAALQRYVCHFAPPASAADQEAVDRFADVKLALARTYYGAHQWEQAAEVFRSVAFEQPRAEGAAFAANLYLDALNTLQSQVSGEPNACLDQMTADAPVLEERYCAGAAPAGDDVACATLSRVSDELEGITAQRLVRRCDAGGPEALPLCEQGGDLYMKIWKGRLREACELSQPGCDRADAVLFNAARAYQAAHLVASATQVRLILVDPRYHLQDTALARQSRYDLGAGYQAIAVYDEAATWYERFAAADPTSARAPDALADAVVLRLGLGEPEAAFADADAFRRAFGTQKPALAAQIAFSVGAYLAERGDLAAAERRLSAAMAQIDASASFDVKIEAHALRGRIAAATKHGTTADAEYQKVRDAWHDPKEGLRLVALAGDADGEARRVGRVVASVGEALTHFAEKKRAVAEAIAFPVYRGSGRTADVDHFVKTEVASWMSRKEPAIVAAEQAYFEVKDLVPAAPPKWVIRGAQAAGDLWARYFAQAMSAPYPKDWDRDDYVPNVDPPLLYAELKAIYLNRLGEVLEPVRVRAKTAFKGCLKESIDEQYFDEASRACERWLSKQYPSEYHMLDEYRPAPSRVNSGLDERSELLGSDGQPLRPAG